MACFNDFRPRIFALGLAPIEQRQRYGYRWSDCPIRLTLGVDADIRTIEWSEPCQGGFISKRQKLPLLRLDFGSAGERGSYPGRFGGRGGLGSLPGLRSP